MFLDMYIIFTSTKIENQHNTINTIKNIDDKKEYNSMSDYRNYLLQKRNIITKSLLAITSSCGKAIVLLISCFTPYTIFMLILIFFTIFAIYCKIYIITPIEENYEINVFSWDNFMEFIFFKPVEKKHEFVFRYKQYKKQKT